MKNKNPGDVQLAYSRCIKSCTRPLLFAFFAASLLCLPACREDAAQPEEYFPPHRDQGGWRKNTSKEFVESLGLNYAALQQLEKVSASAAALNSAIPGYDDHNHASALVIKNGWIVSEWHLRPESKSFQQYLSSNGKTFAYALFGVLMRKARQGVLPVKELNENSRLYDPLWLTDGYPLSDPRKVEITFEQVFQHTAGFMPEETADKTPVEKGRYQWSHYGDWVVGHDPKFPETGRLFFDPGKPEQWPGSETWGQHQGAYSSIGFAHLGIAFRHISGHSADNILWHWLLEPIGFDSVSYHAPPGGGYHRWLTAGGLRMTARDYARFCWFLMKKGRWKNERVWRSPNYQNLRSNVDGWLGEELPADTLRIYGSGSNFVYIIPSLELIALHCGRTSNEVAEKLEQKFKMQLLRTLRRNTAEENN